VENLSSSVCSIGKDNGERKSVMSSTGVVEVAEEDGESQAATELSKILAIMRSTLPRTLHDANFECK
jgi:hypothetical protein